MENQSLQLNEQAISALKEGAKWSYFLSILGFIGVGLMIIASLFISRTFSSLPNVQEETTPLGFDPSNFGTFFAVFYIIFAVVYFFPVYYLFKYSSGVKEAIQTKSTEVLGNAFVNLKSHYKFIGISVLLVISLYALIFIITISALLLR